MQYGIENDDVLEWARNYDGEKFHAMLCDPPYELGFMGKDWDRSGIAFQPETWAALAEHLHDGAFGMAFASSRGWHRMAVAIEDAGLIIHPTIFGWGFGCLSEDTEILTADGWKPYHNLFAGLSVACYNTNLDTVDFQPIEEVYTYDYNDTAYHIKSDKTDQIVSRNHRCIVERGGKKIFQQAETLKSKESVPILENLQGLQQDLHNRELNTMEQRQGLLLQGLRKNKMWWAEYTQKKTRGKNRKSSCLSDLRQIFLSTNGVAEENKRQTDMLQHLQGEIEKSKPRNDSTHAPDNTVRGKGFKCAREPQKERDERLEKPRLERWSYLSQPQRQLSELFNKICSLPSRVYNYGSKRRLCYGASFEGGSTNWAAFNSAGGSSPYRPRSRKQRHIEPDVICNQRRTQSVRGEQRAKTSTTMATVTPIHYEGVVWCVKVPTGAFVARRNGKVFVTGNSGFPKATRIDTQIDKAAKVDCPDCGDLLQNAYKQIAIDYLDDPSDLQIEHIMNIEKRPETWSDADRELVNNAEQLKKNCNRCNGTGKVSAYDVREVVGVVDMHYDNAKRKNEKKITHAFDKGRPNALKTLTTITTPLAQAFAGHRYGLQALKPAIEPIIVFQKPYKGKPVANITATGAGALNIDGGRIGTDEAIASHRNTARNDVYGKFNEAYTKGDSGKFTHTNGRWPANFILTHSPDCVKHTTTKRIDVTEEQKTPWTYEEFFENYDNIPDDFTDEQVRELYKATPKFWRKTVKVGEREEVTERWQCAEGCAVIALGEQSGNNAARYFFNADWSLDVAEQLANADPVRYQAKASRKERDAGLEGFNESFKSASNGAQIHGESYDKAQTIGLNKTIKVKNPHPTVKPLTLTQHLATLLLPPNYYAPDRRLLVPFSGSGSEMIGALLAGWDFVQGIDLTAEYVEIAHARINHWLKQQRQISFFEVNQ